MGLLDFFRKRLEREKENGKRNAILIREVSDWVNEDLEGRTFLVCVSAVTRTIAHLGIKRAEKQWRFMMTEHDDFVQPSKEAEGGRTLGDNEA